MSKMGSPSTSCKAVSNQLSNSCPMVKYQVQSDRVSQSRFRSSKCVAIQSNVVPNSAALDLTCRSA